MNKSEIKDKDICIFMNGKRAEVGPTTRAILETFYTDDLKCINKPEYDVFQILRPSYEVIFQSPIDLGDDKVYVRKNR